MERKMTRKSKAKQERYVKRKPLYYEQFAVVYVDKDGFTHLCEEGDRWLLSDSRKGAESDLANRREYYTPRELREWGEHMIVKLITCESKLVRVRSKPKSGGKSK